MSRHRLPLNALRAFEAAARHLSVGRAAEELCVTPGAVSQQIQQLEAWMKIPLFMCSGRQLTLTSEGQQLGTRLKPAFDQLERAIDELCASTSPSLLRLRLAPTLAIRWLIPALAEFIGQHPEIEVEVNTTAITDEDVLDDIDLAVRIRATPPENEDWLKLFDDAFVPVCSPATASRLHALADLERVPRLHSIIRPESWGIWLAHAGLALDPHAGPRFANAALAYQAAADDLGEQSGSGRTSPPMCVPGDSPCRLTSPPARRSLTTWSTPGTSPRGPRSSCFARGVKPSLSEPYVD